MDKFCGSCKKELPRSDFNKNKSRKDGLHNICRKCHSEYCKNHYKKNLEYYTSKSKRQRKSFNKWWHEYKSKFVCLNCAENDYCCIDFHHLFDDKKDNIASFVRSKNKTGLLLELEKCIPLCSNCHRKLHFYKKHSRVA